jgi:hypothetical protein
MDVLCCWHIKGIIGDWASLGNMVSQLEVRFSARSSHTLIGLYSDASQNKGSIKKVLSCLFIFSYESRYYVFKLLKVFEKGFNGYQQIDGGEHKSW